MVGVFAGGVLVLPVVPSAALMAEQSRVAEALESIVVGQRPHTQPGRWSPHVTCAYGVPVGRVDEAAAIILGHLPLVGTLASGGVEDGTTGEGWPAG